MSELLQGVAFITGAASGIGRGTALAFAKNGIRKLAIGDVKEAEIQSTASEVEKAYPGVTCLPLVVDVSSEASVQAAVKAVVDKFGGIDIAVNNAGVSGPVGKAPSVKYEDWRACFDVNIHGVWLCQRAEIAQMVQQELVDERRGRGVIINTASMFGLVGSSFPVPITAYAAAKHAVVGLTRTDAIEHSKDGIRINAICPGHVDTPLTTKALEAGFMDDILKRTPMRRVGRVEEITDCMVFLASPMSSYMTGTTLAVDGGYTAV